MAALPVFLIVLLLLLMIIGAYITLVSSLFLVLFAGMKYCWPASWKMKVQGLPTEVVLQCISLLVTVVTGGFILYKYRWLIWEIRGSEGQTAEDEFVEYCRKYVQVSILPTYVFPKPEGPYRHLTAHTGR